MTRWWSWSAWCVLACAGAACGGGDDDGGGRADGSTDAADGAPADGPGGDAAAQGPCDGNGTGQVEGTVGGEAVNPVGSAKLQIYQVFDKRFSRVLFLAEGELPAGCPPYDGPVDPGDGDVLSFLFCDLPSAWTYDLIPEEDFPLPDPEFSCRDLSTGRFNAPSDPGIVSGTITLEEVGPHEVGCVTGSFSAVFEGGDVLEGTFNALRCESK